MSGANTIIASVIAATGITVLSQILDGAKSFQPVIGGFIVGTFLLLVAMFNEAIAASFAVILLVSAVLLNGSALLRKVTST